MATPTTVGLEALVFRCSVTVFLTRDQGTNFVNIGIDSANRGAVWVVAEWPALTLQRGVELTGGRGSVKMLTPNKATPSVYVFADQRKRPSDLGCAL